MAVSWSDPSTYLAGFGTALGAGSGIYGMIQNANSYNDFIKAAERREREAQARQDQALQWMQDSQSRVQTLAQSPLDVNKYFSPMQELQQEALKRETMNNFLSSGRMSPQQAQRTYMFETLPKFVGAQYKSAADIAAMDRQYQLNAMGFMPGAQALMGSLNPGAQGVLSAMGGVPQMPAMGDVSAFGSHVKNQQLMQQQRQATGEAGSRWNDMFEWLKKTHGPAATQNIPGTSTYDPHKDRIGASDAGSFTDYLAPDAGYNYGGNY